MRPIECKCNPDAHGRIVSIDAALLRRVRKNSLEQAAALQFVRTGRLINVWLG